MTTTIGSLDLNSANSLYNDATQYFWFESDSTATYGAGVHITLSPSATFMSNPTGQNILINTDGISIRNGLLPMMTLGNDSLDFNVVDTTNGTYTNVASFGSVVSIGTQDAGNILIGTDGITINSGDIQMASLTTSGITLKTSEGADALTILASGGSRQETITTDVKTWYTLDSNGKVVGWQDAYARIFDIGTFTDSTITIHFSQIQTSKNNIGTISSVNINRSTSLVTQAQLATKKLISNKNYPIVRAVALYYNDTSVAHTNMLRLNFYVDNEDGDAYKCTSNYYIYIDSITVTRTVNAPLIKTTGVMETEALRINSNDVTDYIIENGSSGIWKWHKYASGQIKCWGEKTWTGVECSTSAGGGYRSGDQTQALPSGLFTAIDVCQATMKGSGGDGYTMALRTLCTPTAISQMFWNTSNATKSTCIVDYYIIGT